MNEVWGNTTYDHSGSWSETLPDKDAKIYKIYPKTNTGTSQVSLNSVFSISPNPCSGKLEVKFNNDQKIKNITIYSLLGAKVRQYVEPSASILLDGLNSGMYFISATSTNGKIQTVTLIKK